MRFDPYRLTERESINRVLLLDWGGQRAYHLLSRSALIRQLRQQIDFQGTDEALLYTLEYRWLPEEHAGAMEVIKTRGKILGDLLLTLKHGLPAARPEWTDDHWRYWRQIERIYLGGGLMAELTGKLVLQYAQQHIGEAYTLLIPNHPAQLPLSGAARSVPVENGRALLLDCGGTAMKRAYADYRQGQLVRLAMQPPLPAGDMPGANASLDEIEALMVRTVQAAAALWQPDLYPMIVFSVASYVADGQPISSGSYGLFRQLAADVEAEIANRLRKRIHEVIAVKLMHDGTAAATAFAGAPDTAVITMGTALGVGFAPPADGVRPLADKFRIVYPFGYGSDSTNLD